ncbi:MAG TPA: efflux transporter outer membrane subunit [Steroidobacteraceae bacterium]|nr:efflux transporter outer membrane subunit [Steroidobacteraceae bacterium]
MSPRTRLASHGLAFAAALALGGCVLPPKDQPQLTLTQDAVLGLGATNAPEVDAHWWSQYGDAQFDRLADAALEHNPNLQEALARINLAQAQVQAATGTRQPNTIISGEVTRQRYPENSIYPPPLAGNTYWSGDLSLSLSWDLDLWGRQRALIDSVRATTDATRLDSAAARLAITASLAQAYLDLDRAYSLADIAAQSEAQRRHILEITRKRIAAGLDTNVELREAEAAVPQAELGRLQAESARDVAVHRVVALTGGGAGDYSSIARPTLAVETALVVPDSLPADLLGRRPDILAARARAESAKSLRSAARASFYPNVNLKAFVGFEAIGLDNLAKWDDRTAGAGPALSLPIFSAPRLRAQYSGAVANEDMAIATYNGAVVTAIQQTADQLTFVRSSALQLDKARESLGAAEDAYRLAQKRYQAGLANYLSVLATETQVLSARTSYVDVLHSQALARIGLLLAVGGNFSPRG